MLAIRPEAEGLTCADKTITAQILSIFHRLEQEAVLRVLRDLEVRCAWCEQVARKLDEYWNAVSAFFFEH